MIPKRTFLLRQVEQESGKMKDVIARKGEAIEVTVEESKRLATDLEPVTASFGKKK